MLAHHVHTHVHTLSLSHTHTARVHEMCSILLIFTFNDCVIPIEGCTCLFLCSHYHIYLYQTPQICYCCVALDAVSQVLSLIQETVEHLKLPCNALATFSVLSYVKILNVSFQFLTSSLVNGQLISKRFWYYDGRVVMTSVEYLPYLVLALSVLLAFNVFPLVLLALYPFKFFQVFLNNYRCLKYKLALQLFIDLWLLQDDYHHFAALYLAVRFAVGLPCLKFVWGITITIVVLIPISYILFFLVQPTLVVELCNISVESKYLCWRE